MIGSLGNISVRKKRKTKPLVLGRTGERIYQVQIPIPFPLKTVNVYVIEDEPLTLVDTGVNSENGLKKLGTFLRSIDHDITEIKRIILTHGHLDHFGLASRISALSSAEIIIHSADKQKVKEGLYPLKQCKEVLLRNGIPLPIIEKIIEYWESNRSLWEPLHHCTLVNEDTMILFRNFTLKIIHCPGHSPGSICLFHEKEKILFSGDHIIEGIIPNPVLEIDENRYSLRSNSFIQYLNSLKKLNYLPISLILPGHGSMITDLKTIYDSYYNHFKIRQAQILSFLNEGQLTAYEISWKLFSNLSVMDTFLGVSMILGHLDFLEVQELVGFQEKGGKFFYHRKNKRPVRFNITGSTA